jgi:hypothetical protein
MVVAQHRRPAIVGLVYGLSHFPGGKAVRLSSRLSGHPAQEKIMLQQLFNEIEQAQEPLTIAELGTRLSLEPGIVSEMVLFWVRKGRLSAGDGIPGADASQSPIRHCGSECRGPENCHFIARMPSVFTLEKR